MNKPENTTRREQDRQDDQLLRRYRQGDRTAFDNLYERIAGRLLAFALQLTNGQRADAEDLVQETFLAAYRGVDGFHGRSRVVIWLFGIMARRHRDRNRTPQPDSLSMDSLNRELAHTATLPEDAALSSLLLQEAIAQLDDRLREAFLLVVGQGMTHREAATVLGIPVGTVKWRVAEAVKHLRVSLHSTVNEREELTNEPGKMLKVRL